jgi:hypothetical protein
VQRELGYSGKPEYFFHHDVVGLWVGAERREAWLMTDPSQGGSEPTGEQLDVEPTVANHALGLLLARREERRPA